MEKAYKEFNSEAMRKEEADTMKAYNDALDDTKQALLDLADAEAACNAAIQLKKCKAAGTAFDETSVTSPSVNAARVARAKFTIAKGKSAKATKDLGIAKAAVAAEKINWDKAEEDRAKAGTSTSAASTAAKKVYDLAQSKYKVA
jgi:hypothetical protein